MSGCIDPWWHDGPCDLSCAESPYSTTEPGAPVSPNPNIRTVNSEAQSKGRPNGARTPGRPSNLTGDEAGMDSSSKRMLAVEFLDLQREANSRGRRDTLYYVELARSLGVTYAEIGLHLGITEGGVRMMLRRAARDGSA